MKKLLLLSLALSSCLNYSMETDKSLLEQLNGLEDHARKEAIKFWCDEFKSKLKTVEKDKSCSIWHTSPSAFYLNDNSSLSYFNSGQCFELKNI